MLKLMFITCHFCTSLLIGLDVSEGVAKIYADLKREQPDQVAGPVAIFKAAGQGDLQTVKEIIRKYPDAVLIFLEFSK